MNIRAWKEDGLHSLSVEELKEIEEKQKKELDALKVTEVIYYQGFDQPLSSNKSMWTVSLLASDKGEVLARGLSVLSDLDNLRKIEGRVRGRGRALRALKSGRDSALIKIRPDNMPNTALVEAYTRFGFKSMSVPTATSYEAELVKSALK